jgi:hypothetical protein
MDNILWAFGIGILRPYSIFLYVSIIYIQSRNLVYLSQKNLATPSLSGRATDVL